MDRIDKNEESVYVCDGLVKGVQNLKDFTFVDQQFIDSIDPTIFKVFVYEPPYKKGQLLRKKKSFKMEKKVPGEDKQ
ncbi:hypothetical protein [Paenisporosarcina sp. OV554]|uniref:hypothetical protein n=1 Tax=Paenisporosarcina sp. OV554 TaxID=2135694 RepID=UPI000D3D44A5|nr:hypothetical protein [Paenisporosarcina sp. OV554]PUB10086.1 hypothetical protein C8K15_12113 [Paenisporosarcina sp. OV554]